MTQISGIGLYKITTITGDIASWSSLSNLTNFAISSPGITGDISTLANCPKLMRIHAAGCSISGDVSGFKSKTNLRYLDVNNLHKPGMV